MQQPIDYLSPDVPQQLPWHDVPLLVASDETVAGYGCLVDDPDDFDIEIVQWPAQGWRPIDAGTGDEGGVVEGVFHSEWRGEILHGNNDAVDGSYILGWSTNPGSVDENVAIENPERVLLWHMNYHPDGGQLFYPLEGQPFVVPAALPGDDLRLEDIVALWCDGSRGLYIHPGIWHEGVFPATRAQSFRDRQGRVHARVSCNVAQEFAVFLNVPLRPATF
ncbi:MAG: ureidoglycolate hydrolase [Gammaproteobacteria bacterium]|nr:ureidoglycolate hydrolase [Gammaproteobacteria bacterium]